MSEVEAAHQLIHQFGLSESEARGFAPSYRGALARRGPALSAREREKRRERLAEIDANLAIESLALAPEELRFFEHVDELNLADSEADCLLRDYNLARARSVAQRAKAA